MDRGSMCVCGQAIAQQANRLDCQGSLSGAPATISGDRQFTPTSGPDDGYVQFQGSIAAAGMQVPSSTKATQRPPLSAVLSTARLAASRLACLITQAVE